MIFAGVWRLWGMDWAILAAGVLLVLVAVGMERLGDARPPGGADE